MGDPSVGGSRMSGPETVRLRSGARVK